MSADTREPVEGMSRAGALDATTLRLRGGAVAPAVTERVDALVTELFAANVAVFRAISVEDAGT